MIFRDATPEFVERILRDPEMFSRLSCEGQSIDDVSAKDAMSFARWFECVTESGEKVGAFAVHPESVSSLIVHIHILEEYRKEHAFDCAMAGNKWMLENMPKMVNKLSTKVPVCFESVYWFSIKCGWKDEGVDRASYFKDGKYIDRHIVGITREEMAACLP